MITWLSRFPAIKLQLERFNALSTRERVLLQILVVLLLGLGLVFLALLPTSEFRSSNVQALSSTQNAVEWMRSNQGEARRQAGAATSPSSENRLSVISRSANLFDITIRRIQPRAESIDIELLEQPSNQVLSWIESLEVEQHFQLVSVRIDKVESGLVNCRLSLR